MIVFHLIDFSTTTNYRLELPKGRMTGKWKVYDNDGLEIEIESFTFKSNKSSENHNIILSLKTHDMVLAIIGIDIE